MVRSRRPRMAVLVLLTAVACLGVMALPGAALAGVSTGDGVWIWQNPLPQGNVLNSGWFIDAQQGWFVGDYGTIIHTTDGGASWEGQPSGTLFPLTSVCFTDAQHGWAVGNYPGADLLWDVFPPGLIATSDGGKTWYAQTIPITGIQNRMNTVINCIRFTDPFHGWAVGSYWHDGAYHALILATQNGGQTWVQQGPKSVGIELTSVCFADSQHGWAVGGRMDGVASSLSVLATSDGGVTWTTQDSTFGNMLNGVSFVDQLHGWAVGIFGKVVRTSDGGATWTMASIGTMEKLAGVAFTDVDHGTVIGADGTVYTTSDGGSTWSSKAVNPPGVMLRALVYADAQHSWIVGARYENAVAVDCYVMSTSDGGVTWDPPVSYETADLKDVSFVSRTQGWAVGANGVILATADGGDSWLRQDSGTTGELRAVQFLDALTGWAVGDPGILATTDGGVTWQVQFTTPMNDVSVIDALHGFAAVDFRVWATSDGGTTWTPTAPVAADYPQVASISFVDAQHGWVAGKYPPGYGEPAGYGFVYATSDGGATWHRQYSDPLRVNTVFFVDPSYGWLSHDNAKIIMRTKDGGQTWQSCDIVTEHSGFSSLQSLDFIDRQHGWSAGTLGYLLGTSDGQHWVEENSGTTRDLDGVSFVDQGHGWVVGAGGVILKDPSPICYAPYKTTVRKGYTATLKYKVSDAAAVRVNVTIKIRNRMNVVVKKLTLSNKAPNKLLSAKFLCTLRRGTYTFYVYATDTAGRKAAVPGINKLVVK